MHPEELQKKLAEADKEQQSLRKQVNELTQEIEDLSYAISHDLRAPLRAVHGFTAALREDYEQNLDPQAQRYLSIITASTQQMSRMIDGVLTLSRLGRQPMRRSEVEMQSMLEELVAGLKAKFPDRRLDFVIGRLPNIEGDPALLEQVWTQLLLNALKFTNPRESARIEIGSVAGDNEVTYFVRDNGVGFDMKYEGKLFGLFQRFHTEKEFEGTGVGLAVVRRLVRRHEGRAWAEAAVDGGATFYFALPK
jgi:light-regulated signal transduction histidine kinase (bacteriophytochrome)